MGIKALASDSKNVQRLIIWLNRENMEALLRGEVLFMIPGGIPLTLTADDDIAVIFAETDDELAKRLPPVLRPD